MSMIAVNKETERIVIPFDSRVANVVPGARTVDGKAGEYLILELTVDTLLFLKNLGYDVPSMLELSYDWRGTIPFDSQRVTAGLMASNKRAYVLNEMGTGKTRAALYAFDYLHQQGLAQRMLVVAPLSILTTVWEVETFNIMPHLTVQTLWHYNADKRREMLNNEADIYVINHDGIKVLQDDLRLRSDIDCILIDELAVFRNKNTDRWKVLNSLLRGREYAWGMTGSPTPRKPTDAWAQIRLLTPERTARYFNKFRDATMQQVSQFQWLARPEANDIVFDQMQPAVRFTRKQCVDLPPTTVSTRHIELTTKQKKAYTTMKAAYFAQIEAGTVIAANAGVRQLKIVQLSSGFLFSDGVPYPIDSNRIKVLTEVVDECAHKVIVFATFVPAVDFVHSQLVSAGIDSAKVYGATPKRERDNIFHEFQNTDRYKVLVAHPATTAHGLTLTAADTIVWFNPEPSLEIYEQANARITRPGQTRHTHIVHLESTDIERLIYKRLGDRSDAQSALLTLYEEETGNVLGSKDEAVSGAA